MRPIITLGSPFGIGYEILLLSEDRGELNQFYPITVIGSKSVLEFFCNELSIIPDIQYVSVHNYNGNVKITSKIVCIDIDEEHENIKSIKEITPSRDGYIAYNSIKYAANFIDKQYFSGMVTLPVSKENINLIDKSFKGHTEFLMKLWNEKQVFMCFISDDLNIMLMTTHIPLKDVPKTLNSSFIDLVLEYSKKLYQTLKFKKHICVLGLNPHAGENGLIGQEDKILADGITRSKIKNPNVIIDGPVPADTAFIPYNREKYDLYIACYHDQGLIPFKMLAFDTGVNLSFGMKYIRTSVDHGTAINLIGKKTASSKSFIEAYKLLLNLS